MSKENIRYCYPRLKEWQQKVAEPFGLLDQYVVKKLLKRERDKHGLLFMRRDFGWTVCPFKAIWCVCQNSQRHAGSAMTWSIMKKKTKKRKNNKKTIDR